MEAVDIGEVLSALPDCHRICTTGGKATEILLSLLETEIKANDVHLGETITAHFNSRELSVTRLPSTSRAYPMKLLQKAAFYRTFFAAAGFDVAPLPES